VGLHHPDRADDVEHAGLVLEVEEGDAHGGARPLAVGDQTTDVDAPVGLGGGELLDRADPGTTELVAQVLDRVALG
jgi:hypothetical protein